MFTKLLRVPECADLLGVSKSLVYRLISQGKLKGVKFNRTTRIRVADLEEFISNSLTQGTNPNSEGGFKFPIGGM
jgi:excisionase family DNA binding protein